MHTEAEKHHLWSATLLRFAGGGCVVVAIVDTCGSLLSLALKIPYGWFAIVSLMIYCALGVLAARRGSIASAAAAGAIVSVFDATVGWWISWRIGPGRADGPDGPAGIHALLLTGIFVVSFETTLAVIAALISERLRGRRS